VAFDYTQNIAWQSKVSSIGHSLSRLFTMTYINIEIFNIFFSFGGSVVGFLAKKVVRKKVRKLASTKTSRHTKEDLFLCFLVGEFLKRGFAEKGRRAKDQNN
jgi:hypothetical protein